MKTWKTVLLGAALLLFLGGGILAAQPTQVMAQEGEPIPDHLEMTAYEGASTCLECHEDAAQEIMATSHWTWEYEDPVSGQLLGKNNVINNYCIAVSSNEPRCTSCHIGWGYADATFDFSDENAVDCLVCHDTTGTYKKFPTAAGFPVIGEAREFGGKVWEPVDLVYVAQNVGPTSRDTCGACHFYGGGGDAVKHGDLDSTMHNPAADVDVHMSPDGEDFACTECHETEKHDITGTRYSSETVANDVCASCHLNDPHESKEAVDGLMQMVGDVLNEHTDRIACQTCHIPEFARGGKPTKMFWDWSTAGNRNEDGSIIVTRDEATGMPVYDSRKGSFVWEANVVPQYMWFNGQVTYITLDDTVDPEEVVLINQLHGDRSDEEARIVPVKVFDAVQPYDAGLNTLAVPHLFGKDDTAYWKNWDWALALAAGQASVGREFSGQVGFIASRMYWVQNHMVAPAEMALTCESCHSATGRLDFAALGYTADEIAVLSQFPPVEPEPTEVPTEVPPTPVPPTEVSPTEEPPSEEVALPAPAEDTVAEAMPADEAPAESPSNGWVVWALAAVVVVGGLAFYFSRK